MILNRRFHNGPEPLSTVLRKSLLSDPLNPVLVEGHFQAIDRRVERILITVRSCIQQKKAEQFPWSSFGQVVVDDSF